MKRIYSIYLATLFSLCGLLSCYGQPGIARATIDFSIEDNHGNIITDLKNWEVTWYGNDTIRLNFWDTMVVIENGYTLFASMARTESKSSEFFIGQAGSTEGCIEVVRSGKDTMRVFTPYSQSYTVQLHRMPFVAGEFEIPELVYLVYSGMKPLWRQRLSPHQYKDWEKFRKGAPLPYRNLVIEQVESFDQNSKVDRLVPYGLDDCYLDAVDLYSEKYWFNDENNFFRLHESMKTFIPKEQKDTSSYEGLFLVLISGTNYYFLDSAFRDFTTKITSYSPIYYGELEIPIGEGYEFQKRQGKFELFTRLLIDEIPYVFGSYPGLNSGYNGKRGIYKIHFSELDGKHLNEIINHYRKENGLVE